MQRETKKLRAGLNRVIINFYKSEAEKWLNASASQHLMVDVVITISRALVLKCYYVTIRFLYAIALANSRMNKQGL